MGRHLLRHLLSDRRDPVGLGSGQRRSRRRRAQARPVRLSLRKVHFLPFAVETAGVVGPAAAELVKELGRRLTARTGDRTRDRVAVPTSLRGRGPRKRSLGAGYCQIIRDRTKAATAGAGHAAITASEVVGTRNIAAVQASTASRNYIAA